MGRINWSAYPGDPPEPRDPHPKSEELYDLLEKAGVAQEVIDAACAIVDELADTVECLSNQECQYCERRQAEEYRKSREDFEKEIAKPSFGSEP